MTPALLCNQNCMYCWRPLELLSDIRGWDEPDYIAEESISAQRTLLSGLGGIENVNRKKLKEAYEPNQVAISLIGEPTLYPHLDGLVEEYKARGMTTFVVTNGTRPDMVRKIEPYQLYISLTAYSEESHIALNRPAKSLWDKILQSLDIMAGKDCRTVIRLTLVRGYNIEARNFVSYIERASPDFIETKAYMHLGYSRLRLPRSAMPEHSEVKAFAEELAKLTGYEVKDESPISRVVLLRR